MAGARGESRRVKAPRQASAAKTAGERSAYSQNRWRTLGVIRLNLLYPPEWCIPFGNGILQVAQGGGGI